MKSLTLRRAVIAVALAGSGVVLIASTAAVGAGPDRGALQQLGGPKGCWVFQAADGCSVYSVPRGNGAQVAFNTVSTAVSPDGANLYVAANSYSNLIIAFARASDGSLAPVRGRGGCILPLAGGCQAPVYRQRQLSGLAVSPDGRDLYSLADYRPVEGVQTLIRVAGGGLRGAQSGVSCGTATGADADDRRHKCEYTVELGSGPRALALSPDGHEIYAATDDGVVTLDRTQTGGVYLAGCLGRTVAPVRDTTCAPVRAASDASGVAVSPDGRYVYLASAVGLDVFARNAKTGGLTQLAGTAGCVDATGAGGCAVGRAVARPTDPTRSGGSRVTMSRDGQNVYLAAADGIATFARSAKTGALTQLAGPAGCISQTAGQGCAVGRSLAGIEGLKVSPDGRSVYAAAYTSRGLAVMTRAPDGSLTQSSQETGCVNAAGSGGCSSARGVGEADTVSVSPDSATVYVGSFDAGLAVFHRG